jgi:hypothetical protein
MQNGIVKQARGIVLDEQRDYAPVCYGYDHFDNYDPNKHSGLVSPSDWIAASVSPKLDGTMIMLYVCSIVTECARTRTHYHD